MHSITTKRMTAEHIKPDTFKPHPHKVKQHIEAKITALLKEYNSSVPDETSIGTTPLTGIMIDKGTFDQYHKSHTQLQ